MAESYIDFHLGNVEDLEVSKETREALCEKRLSEGWFLYSLLEIKQRYLIQGFYFFAYLVFQFLMSGPLLAKIDDSLEIYNEMINQNLSRDGVHTNVTNRAVGMSWYSMVGSRYLIAKPYNQIGTCILGA